MSALSLTLPVPDDEMTIAIESDGDIVIARLQARTFLLQLGFSSPEAVLVATAISELARNIVLYAGRGEIALKPLDDAGRRGVLVVARDHGPGIPEVQQAVILAGSATETVGLGLRGVRRLVDECEIASRVGCGTTIALKKWKADLGTAR